MKPLLCALITWVLSLGVCSPAAAILPPSDHEKCYKITDPAKIKGTVDLTTPQFGLEPGCKVGAAKYFCAPASKSNVTVTSKGVPVVPLPVYAPPAPTDRICYKIKCPVPPPPFPPDQNVTDQFGNRTLTKFTAAFMCTPAVKGAGFCGNGVIDAGEDCDAPALGACPAGCDANCTCTCVTACCYMENFANPPDTGCVEYTGKPGQVASFSATCAGGSQPAGSIKYTALAGSCALGPTFGFPCGGGSPNEVVAPADARCP